jgi:hypothetical protein
MEFTVHKHQGTHTSKLSDDASVSGTAGYHDTASPIGGVRAIETNAVPRRKLLTTLKNLTYTRRIGDTIEVVELINGKRDIGTDTYALQSTSVGFGDLDGDGKIDAVAVIGKDVDNQ